ncbi:hypothetical protein DL93DRAFT_542167 [Clavulina sp. PMI_390]|nr:hypothetical protein DL93DRAFT_542167 [Clavulina sp. PMI_390]
MFSSTVVSKGSSLLLEHINRHPHHYFLSHCIASALLLHLIPHPLSIICAPRPSQFHLVYAHCLLLFPSMPFILLIVVTHTILIFFIPSPSYNNLFTPLPHCTNICPMLCTDMHSPLLQISTFIINSLGRVCSFSSTLFVIYMTIVIHGLSTNSTDRLLMTTRYLSPVIPFLACQYKDMLPWL